MAIEIRQTKRRIVYRAVVPSAEPGSRAMSKTFRTRAAAEAWERKMLATDERTRHPDGSNHPGTRPRSVSSSRPPGACRGP